MQVLILSSCTIIYATLRSVEMWKRSTQKSEFIRDYAKNTTKNNNNITWRENTRRKTQPIELTFYCTVKVSHVNIWVGPGTGNKIKYFSFILRYIHRPSVCLWRWILLENSNSVRTLVYGNMLNLWYFLKIKRRFVSQI